MQVQIKINNVTVQLSEQLLTQMVYAFVMSDKYMELGDADADTIGSIEDLLEKEE